MNIAIAFASLSGNTISVADDLQNHLIEQGHTVKLYDTLQTSADKLKAHDLVFMGCSTYGDGELNPIAEMFFSDAESGSHSCNHVNFAIFALGDSSYTHFAASGEIVHDKLTKMGASVVKPLLTLDGIPDIKMFEKVRHWSREIIAKISQY